MDSKPRRVIRVEVRRQYAPAAARPNAVPCHPDAAQSATQAALIAGQDTRTAIETLHWQWFRPLVVRLAIPCTSGCPKTSAMMPIIQRMAIFADRLS